MSTIPGSYADEKDLVVYYSALEGVEVSDPDNGDRLTIDNVRLRQALIAASNYINSKLAKRYVVPLENWGEDIVRVTCAIAMHDNLDLWDLRDATKIRYQYAIDWLNEIRNGDADLTGNDGSIIPEKPIGIDAGAIGWAINIV